MTMIERVARAIHAETLSGTGFEWPDKGCQFCLKSAKRAIEAMREPTKEMADAGHLYGSIGSEDASDMFNYMIEAALKE